MKFMSNMHSYCSYCLKRLYGDENCICAKTHLEKQRDIEIEESKHKITNKYHALLEVDNLAIQEFTKKHERNTPSYW